MRTMKSEERKAYLKTLFAVLASVGLILGLVWWYWTRNSADIIRRVIASYKDVKVQEDIGEVLGQKVIGAIVGSKK